MLLYPQGQSTVCTGRLRAKLERFIIHVALILIGSTYLAGVLIRIETAIQR
jgi:hypothetical protein